MLRLDDQQPSLGASVLPREHFEMSEELAKLTGNSLDAKLYRN